MPKIPANLRTFDALNDITRALCGPDGCPWDKEQTHKSLAPFAIEEAHEMAEAAEKGDMPHLKEELGDLLLQVTLHSEKARLAGAFTIEDVLETLNEKMVRRHPHVFGEVKAETAQEVLKNWAQIKDTEKASEKASAKIFDIPAHLPALQRAAKIGQKTKKYNFDWPDISGVLSKVEEELQEVKDSFGESKERQESEIGDLLFSVAQLARHMHIDPEQALREGNRRFESRFEKLKTLADSRGIDMKASSVETLEALWQEIKAN